MRTVGLGIGVQLALQGNYLGPVIFWLIHNIPHFLVRKYGFELGYEKGVELLNDASGSGTLNDITDGAKVVGAMVVGAMIASMISFSTSITLQMGEVTYALQDMFNSFMPKLLPLLITFACFKSMKKGISTTRIMIWLIIAAIIITVLEGLPFFAAVTQ